MNQQKSAQARLESGVATLQRVSRAVADKVGPAARQLREKSHEAMGRLSELLDRDVVGGKGTSSAQALPLPDGEAGFVPQAEPTFDLPPLEPLRTDLQVVSDVLGQVVSGRSRETRLALVAWLAGGHLLIDGPPGLGKTTLAKALSALLGRQMQRVQFTSDLMPSDLLGSSIYNKDQGRFELHPGPVFSDIVLADEINRAPPRAQSALLEAMAERRVSIDGETRDLSEDFFVIATQNPIGQIGTFPLPESQLDRFLVRVDFGNLDREVEREILSAGDRSAAIPDLPDLSAHLPRDGQAVAQVHIGDRVLDYIQDLIHETRDPSRFAAGLSVRAGLGLMQAARAWAWLHDRDAVEPEDVQAVFAALADHRLVGADGAQGGGSSAAILRRVAVPA